MHTTEESSTPSFSLDVGLQEKLWVFILVGPDQLGIMKKKGAFCQSWHLQNIAVREGVIIECYMSTNKIQCYIDSSKNAVRSITYSFLSLTSNSSPRYVKKRSP